MWNVMKMVSPSLWKNVLSSVTAIAGLFLIGFSGVNFAVKPFENLLLRVKETLIGADCEC